MKRLFTFKLLSLFIFSYLFLANTNNANAQYTEIRAIRDTIACGEELLLTNVPPLIGGSGSDFSTGSLDPGFFDLGLSNFTTMVFSTPCLQPPSSLCSNPIPPAPYFWFPGGAPGNLTTQPLDLCGGIVSFDYRMETQSAPPCDGPDQQNEGMYFQYKNGPGARTTIHYFVPPGNPQGQASYT